MNADEEEFIRKPGNQEKRGAAPLGNKACPGGCFLRNKPPIFHSKEQKGSFILGLEARLCGYYYIASFKIAYIIEYLFSFLSTYSINNYHWQKVEEIHKEKV